MKKKFVFLLVFTALQGLIHNIGHPVTPSLVTGLGIPDYMFGVFFATMSLGLMIASPIFGSWGDKHKKNRLIFIGLLFYSIGQAGFGISGNMYWMVFFRLVSGLGVSGIVTLFVSYVIEISDKEKRARNLAIFAATLTLFASVGYKLGGFLNNSPLFIQLLHTDNPGNLFIIQAVLNTLYALLILFTLKEEEKVLIPSKRLNLFKSLKNMKKVDFSFILFLIAVMFISMGSTNLSKYIDVYFIELGYTSNQLGDFVMVTGIVSILSSLFLVPLFIKIKKELQLMIIIQIISGIIVIFVFRQARFLLFMYTIYNVYVLIRAIYLPFEQNFISEYAEEGAMGTIMGIRQSFVSVGMIIGMVLGGFLYDLKPLLVFDASAAMFFIAFVLFVVVFHRFKRKHMIKEA